VQVPGLGGGRVRVGPARRAFGRFHPGAIVAKIGSRRCTDLVLAADHQAEPAIEPEHAAARPTSTKCTPLLGVPLGAVDVVPVVRVPAVDHDVAGLHQVGQRVGRLLGERGRHHHPRRPWFRELVDEVLERPGPDRPSPSSWRTESALTS
jgi:hypothetical protein